MRHLAPILILAVSLAGCGAAPSTAFDPADYEDGPAVSRGTIDMPTGDGGRPDQDAIDRLIVMEKAQRALPGGSYTATVLARGPEGEARTTFAVKWTRDPALTTLEAGDSTYPAWKRGLRVTLDAKQATLKFPGLRGLLPSKRSLTDAALHDARGHDLVALLAPATVTRLAGTGSGELVGTARVENEAVDLVAIPRGPGFDPEVTREVLAIGATSGLLRRHQMYVGKTLVYEQTLTQLRPGG